MAGFTSDRSLGNYPSPPSYNPPVGGNVEQAVYGGQAEYMGEMHDGGYHGDGGMESDAMQKSAEEHLEDMSKKPAHQRRFSQSSFPHAYQGSPQKQELDDFGYPIENPDEARFTEWSSRLRDELNEMTHSIKTTADTLQRIKDGSHDDEGGFGGYSADGHMYGPKYNHDLIKEVLGPLYDGGVMWKKGGGTGPFNRRNWKERYFVLDVESHPNEPKISYFASRKAHQNNERPKGSLHLNIESHCEIDMNPRERKNKAVKNKIGLHISASTDDGQKRTFMLMVDSLSEANAWKDVVKHIVKQLQQYDDYSMGIQRQSMFGEGAMPGHLSGQESENDEEKEEMKQREKDQAQNCTARGGALYEATVGEQMDFSIEVNHPLSQEKVHTAEATMMDQSFFVTLMTIDEDEVEADLDGDEEEDPDKVEEKMRQKFDEMELDYSKVGKGHLHYDLHPIWDDDEEVFKVKYTVSRVGHYRLKILYEGHHIYGSPFHLVALPGETFAKMSIASGPGILFANPRAVNTFTIEARDKMGNQRGKGGDAFFVEYVGAAIGNGEQVGEENLFRPTDNGDGTYTCQYNVDIEKSRTMLRPNIEINIRIDDGSHFQTSTLDTLQEWQMTYGDDEWDENQEVDENGDPVRKRIERPAWYVQIKGSPYLPPIRANMPDHLLDHSSAVNPAQLSKIYKGHSQLEKAQMETMWNSQRSNTSPSSRFDGFPKVSYEQQQAPPSEGNMQALLSAPSGGRFQSSVHAQREAALAERELKLRQQEEVLRAQARQVDEQKARMDDQMSQIQMMGSQVSESALSARSPMTTPSASRVGRSQAPLNSDSECDALFARFSQPLNIVFKHYGAGGSMTLDQYVRLGLDYDLYPTFLNKAELKKFFVQASQGSQSLSYEGFVDALRITAVNALSKKTFKNLYPTDASKVHVMLSLWGLGDPLKLEQLKSRRR